MDLKTLFALVLAFSIASAGLDDYVKIVDTNDMGSGMSLWHWIGYNCTEQAFYVRYTNATAPQQDVSVYLFYLEYSYQLIDTGKTDASGYVKLNMIGKQSLLNKVFVLRAEKPGFRTSEVQFTVDCSKSADPAPQPQQNNTTPVQNNTANATANGTQNISQNTTPYIPPEEPPAQQNTTGQQVNDATNQLEHQANRAYETGQIPCLGAFVLPLFAMLVFRLKTQIHL